MAELPPSHSLFLDPSTATRSEEIVALLYNNLNVIPPKLFPHEGDSLVLTWDMPEAKRMLSIEANDLDLVDILKRTKRRVRYEPQFQTEEEARRWVLSVAGVPDAVSRSAADAL
jgi:hypothetical protein